MFFKRSASAELIDNFQIKDYRIDRALYELKIINKYLGGNRTSKAGLNKIFDHSINEDLNILDAGAGASDIYPLMQHKYQVHWFTADKNIRACKYLKKNSSGINIICADIFNPPFKKQHFDIIHASLFLHHFTEEKLKEILNIFSDISKKGIVINDLRRNIFAYTGIKILTFLFSGSELIKNDAPLSVKRGFKRSEILSFLRSAAYSEFKIKRKWAFRWLILIKFKA
jgi:2-polyprenyl-3-methyl-5-hydroxy-6-metoxy-1,4-benzoquinol methylase